MHNSPDTNLTIAIVVAAIIGVLGSLITLLIFSRRKKPQWKTLQQMGGWLAIEYSNELKPMSVNERNHIAKVIILSYSFGGMDSLKTTVVEHLRAEQTSIRIVGFVRDLLDYEIAHNKRQFEANLKHLTH